MTDRQKYIIATSFELLAMTVKNSQSLGLSNQRTQMLKMYQAETSGQLEGSFGVNEDCHDAIFNAVLTS